MSFIQPFLTTWLLCIIVLCFIKIKWSIALFLLYLMLVPYINIGISGLGTGDNFIKLLLVIGYYIERRKKQIKFSYIPYVPFVIYFVVSLFMTLFQDGVPNDIMLDYIRKDIMNILFFPIIMWNVMRMDSSSIILFRNTMIICIIISIGYGLILTQLGGINPYAMFFLTQIDTDVNYENYYEDAGGGRLFGRISSVYIHPMAFALFIGLTFIYLLYLFVLNKLNRIFLSILMLLTIIMAVLCGVRSVLGGLFVSLFYYFVWGKKFKIMLLSLIIGILGLSVASSVPELSGYITSITDINNKQQDVSGSSVDMRLQQLEGAVAEASRNPLFGLGYGWTTYYQSLKGDHPICLAFESLLFVVICNSGIVGLFLWLFMVMKILYNNKTMRIRSMVIINALLIFYISYSLITGEYGYMRVFLIFYTLLLGESLLYKKENIHKDLLYKVV